MTELSGGSVLLSADEGPSSVGAKVTFDGGSDGVWAAGESVVVEFVVGLQTDKAFTLFVDVYGVSGG